MKIGRYITFLKSEYKTDSKVLLDEIYKKEPGYRGLFMYKDLIDFEEGKKSLDLNFIKIILNYFNKSYYDVLEFIIKKSSLIEWEFKNWYNLNDDTKSLLICKILFNDFDYKHIEEIKIDLNLLNNPPKGTFNLIARIESIHYTKNNKVNFIFEFEKLTDLIYLKSLILESCVITSFTALISLNILKISNVELLKVESISLLLNLEELHIVNSNLKLASPLLNLKYLKKIKLDWKDFSVEGLGGLPSLESVEILNISIDAERIEELNQIKYLHLVDIKSTQSFNFLNKLHNLENLSITGEYCNNSKININEDLLYIKSLVLKGGISKIVYNFILRFINLESLVIKENSFELKESKLPTSLIAVNVSAYKINFGIVTHCKKLKYLTVNANRYINSSDIIKLTKLEKLSIGPKSTDTLRIYNDKTALYEIPLENTLFLKDLTNLKYLTLNAQRLHKINGIESLQNLKQLELCYNQITDIYPITALASLETLNLSINYISNIDSIRNLKLLKNLDLSYNHLENIQGISVLNLNNLNLEGNNISNIDPINNIKSLYQLNLSYNRINSIYCLSKLKLNSLIIKGNAFSFHEVSFFNNCVQFEIDFNDINVKYYNRNKNYFPVINFHEVIEVDKTVNDNILEINDEYYDYDDYSESKDSYCSSCDSSPCMCSDQENTSSTWW